MRLCARCKGDVQTPSPPNEKGEIIHSVLFCHQDIHLCGKCHHDLNQKLQEEVGLPITEDKVKTFEVWLDENFMNWVKKGRK